MKLKNINDLRDLIKKHEGKQIKNGRHVLYQCAAGKFTCCIGHNAEESGFSDAVAELILTEDILETYYDILSILPEFPTYSENRQHGLISLMFNVGKTGFLSFKKMIKAIKNGDWKEAARQAKDSRWYCQTKSRGIEIVELLRGEQDER